GNLLRLLEPPNPVKPSKRLSVRRTRSSTDWTVGAWENWRGLPCRNRLDRTFKKYRVPFRVRQASLLAARARGSGYRTLTTCCCFWPLRRTITAPPIASATVSLAATSVIRRLLA